MDEEKLTLKDKIDIELSYWKDKWRDLVNFFKFPIQRAIKGYCDRDIWSFEHWFSKSTPRMLRELAKVSHGFPENVVYWLPNAYKIFPWLKGNETLQNLDKHQVESIHKAWQNVLCKLAEKFEYFYDCPDLKEHFKKYNKHLTLDQINNPTEEENKYIHESVEDYYKVDDHRYKVLKEAMEEYTKLLPML